MESLTLGAAAAAGMLATMSACTVSMAPAVIALFSRVRGASAAITAAGLTLGFAGTLGLWTLAASLARLRFHGLPAWDTLLAILYLATGLWLLGVRLPIRVAWLRVHHERRHLPRGGFWGAALVGIALAMAPGLFASPYWIAVLGLAAQERNHANAAVLGSIYGTAHILPLVMVGLGAQRLSQATHRLPGERTLRTVLGLVILGWGVLMLVVGDAGNGVHRH